MAEVTDKPAGLKSTNALDDIDTGGEYVTFRAPNVKLEEPPKIREEAVLMVKVKCVGDGHKLQEDGELRPVRTLKVLGVWKPGSKPPTMNDDQPGLLDHNGEIPDEEVVEDEEAEKETDS